MTLIDEEGNPLLGGDHIDVVDGGGTDSPLVIYGDTSADLGRYIANRGEETPSQPVSASFTVDLDESETLVVVPDDTLFNWTDKNFLVG